ncbi:MAG: rhodanese-like domain-containing protein [Ottowia sp.]|uniref:rhodanese-like domain-containing protein n=1 Tax=unclassified Ottowia TaxID=2645081 RepID=UPI003C2E9B14
MNFVMANWALILLALASGGMLAWPLISGGRSAGALTPSAAVHLMNREKAVVIDVCDAAEYAAGHIVGAKSIPMAELEEKLPKVVKNKAVPVIMVCASGVRSARAVGIAKKLGYEQAQSLGGGLKAWRDANLPVEA